MTTSLSSISPPTVPIAGYANGGYGRIASERPEGQARSGADTPAQNNVVQGSSGQAGSASDEPSLRRAAQADAQPSSDTNDRRQQLVEQQVLRELSARDREVRQHEMAHQAAGGGLTGGVSYSYQRGPDGRMYAVGGEVSIDTSAVSGDPRATLEKAEAIIRAAMAPAEPSSQDYRVAASARAMAAEARTELARLEEVEQTDDADESNDAERASTATGMDPERSDGRSGLESATRLENPRSAADATSAGRSPMAEPRSLNTIEQQLVDSGVYSSLFPSGSLLNLQA